MDSLRFYCDVDSTLGEQFLDAVELAIKVIAEAPDRWRFVEADVRRYLMPRFPFAIYYRSPPDELRILALTHHRQRPGYWRRISEPTGES